MDSHKASAFYLDLHRTSMIFGKMSAYIQTIPALFGENAIPNFFNFTKKIGKITSVEKKKQIICLGAIGQKVLGRQ